VNDLLHSLAAWTGVITFPNVSFFIETWQERIEEGDEIEMQIESEEEEEEEEEEEGGEEDKRVEERHVEEDQEAKEAKDNTQVMEFRVCYALNVEPSFIVSDVFKDNATVPLSTGCTQ
jgi:hypothetical protein